MLIKFPIFLPFLGLGGRRFENDLPIPAALPSAATAVGGDPDPLPGDRAHCVEAEPYAVIELALPIAFAATTLAASDLGILRVGILVSLRSDSELG